MVLSHTISYTPDALRAELHDRGWRMTPQRQIILQAFQDVPEGVYLSAEGLDERFKAQGESIGLSTIYRTVKLMSRIGILRELELIDGQKRYDLNQPSPHHHHHMICVRCSKTLEFRQDSILKVGTQIAVNEGYHVLDCQLSIHAVCPACQQTEPPMNSADFSHYRSEDLAK